LIYLFWDKDPYALITGFFVMTFGDGLAGLIGKNKNDLVEIKTPSGEKNFENEDVKYL